MSTLHWWNWALLILLFGGLFAAWWYVNRGNLSFKKFIQPNTLKIKVLESRWVASQTFVSIVEVDGARFLLARTIGGVAWQPLGEPKGIPPVADEQK